MYEFQFDAPKFCNLKVSLKSSNKIEIDYTNPYDLWFMTQHRELTPIKENKDQQFSPIFQLKEELLPEKEENEPNKKQKRQMKRKQTRNKNPLKREQSFPTSKQSLSVRTDLLKKRQFGKKSFSLLPKRPLPKKQTKSLDETQSENFSNRKNAAKKIRRPCPFPIKVQKEWETSSNKSWYSLSQKSAQKASCDMQKRIKIERKKNKEKKFKPFRF